MPIAFFVAASVQLVSQLFKFIIYSIRDRRVSPKYLVTTGGMPSAHSAFVCSLAAYIGLEYGTAGPWFSVSLVFAAIVMYDAFRLRGFVQKHAVALNKLQALIPEDKREGMEAHSEMVGHSLAEIASGLVLGVAWAALAWALI
jgi:acid phosphatase family membrane protein YuiD